MGDGTRVAAPAKRETASSRPKSPALHQNRPKAPRGNAKPKATARAVEKRFIMEIRPSQIRSALSIAATSPVVWKHQATAFRIGLVLFAFPHRAAAPLVKIQCAIRSMAAGDSVSSISPYSDGAPVLAVWNKWFKFSSSATSARGADRNNKGTIVLHTGDYAK
jgi:hypothetical protein